jgi:uncharacterized protein (DUF1697 family)
MPRYVALLRAINATRKVRMTVLREAFLSLRLSGVRTVLASGNVVFEAHGRDKARLERTIENRLLTTLGWKVPVFVRTGAQLSRIVAVAPDRLRSDGELNVIFVKFPPGPAARRRLLAMNDDVNQFVLNRREIYWHRRRRRNSSYATIPLDKLLGQPLTIRSINTLMRLDVLLATALGRSRPKRVRLRLTQLRSY